MARYEFNAPNPRHGFSECYKYVSAITGATQYPRWFVEIKSTLQHVPQRGLDSRIREPEAFRLRAQRHHPLPAEQDLVRHLAEHDT